MKVISKLKHVIETLKFYELPEQQSTDDLDLKGMKLIDFIDNQTKEIIVHYILITYFLSASWFDVGVKESNTGGPFYITNNYSM